MRRELLSWVVSSRLADRVVPMVGSVVLDSELLMLVDGRLSFEALQRRMVTSPAKAQQLVAAVPPEVTRFTHRRTTILTFSFADCRNADEDVRPPDDTLATDE
ncbi:hypothetical protein GCM10009789_43840 [Kribbella sancticallisti]|uniref:Uncharacterized protein n=1 Tax=Kribbella sancticallisti TaxID=460087 RepID=A0ABN2DUY2_9ACTN